MPGIILGLIAGAGLPVQTAVNSRLRTKFGGNAFYAARYSFTSSTVLILILLAVTGIGFSMPWGDLSGEPFWIWAGGVCGIFYLTCTTILMPILGSVQTVIFPIVGQVIMSLAIDHFGLFGSQVNSLTVTRLAGAVLVLAGAVIISLTKGPGVPGKSTAKPGAAGSPATKPEAAGSSAVLGIRPEAGQNSAMAPGLWLWRLLGVIVGFAQATQTAVNSRLGMILGVPLKATCVSFVVGTICIWIVCLVHRVRNGKPETVLGFSPWWMWTGGIYGVIYILVNIYLANRLGTGMTVLIMLTGIISGGVILENFGVLGVNRRPVTLLKVGCVLMMLAGLAMIRLL